MNKGIQQNEKYEMSLQDIWKAKKRISPVVGKTPLLFSQGLSKLTGSNVYLKLENLHNVGAFKVRGAANKILSLTPEELANGVTTFSTGNFAMCVSYLAKKLGTKAVVCVSKRVPKTKLDKIKQFDAELEICGVSQDEAEQRCYELQNERGLTVIHPFDDPYIIAGQGTIALEVLEDLPEVDMVIGGLSGGGLHSGIGLAFKSTNPNIKIIGVSTAQGAVMYESLKAGRPVSLEERDSLADSLLGGIGLENIYTFEMVRKYVDEIVLINEEEIASGMGFMADQQKMIVEGAAASGIASLLHQKINDLGKNIVLIVSGCSVDTSLILDVTQNYIQTEK